MSSKTRKKQPEGEPAPPKREGPVRPSGKAPEAVVSARHGTGMVARPGRGFSFGELSSSGLAPRLASKWGVRVDVRRRSVLDGNVASLSGWARGRAPARKPEGRVKKLEEDLVKAEKEAEKEALEVKEEVVKVERAVKKGATRAEKAVKSKAKPKAKPKKKST